MDEVQEFVKALFSRGQVMPGTGYMIPQFALERNGIKKTLLQKWVKQGLLQKLYVNKQDNPRTSIVGYLYHDSTASLPDTIPNNVIETTSEVVHGPEHESLSGINDVAEGVGESLSQNEG